MRAESFIFLLTNIKGTEQIKMKKYVYQIFHAFSVNLKLFLKPQVVKKAHLTLCMYR